MDNSDEFAKMLSARAKPIWAMVALLAAVASGGVSYGIKAFLFVEAARIEAATAKREMAEVRAELTIRRNYDKRLHLFILNFVAVTYNRDELNGEMAREGFPKKVFRTSSYSARHTKARSDQSQLTIEAGQLLQD